MMREAIAVKKEGFSDLLRLDIVVGNNLKSCLRTFGPFVVCLVGLKILLEIKIKCDIHLDQFNI